MNSLTISIHIVFLWFQIYICSEFENEHFTGRRSSNHGNLIKTKSGKTFLQRSSKGKKYNTEIQKYNRQIKYHAQETDSGFDEYSQESVAEDTDNGFNLPSTTTSTVDDTGNVPEEEEEEESNVPSGCGTVRIRRNVKSLSKEERTRLVRAMQALIDRGRYQEIGNFHGGPPTICPETDNGYCCSHGSLFLPWHRLYMAQMEEELGEALPYWDWTEDEEVPDLWEGIRAPIKEGESAECEPGSQFTSRKPNIYIDTAKQKSLTKKAFDEDKFRIFQKAMVNPHNAVHRYVGCDMTVDAKAGYDTLFYLHHTFVDYQWAYWQELQLHRPPDEPFSDFNNPIPPFDRVGFNKNEKTLRNSKGRDTLDYRGNFCYEYDRLIFNGTTPSQYGEDQASFGSSNRARSILFRSNKVNGNGTKGGLPHRGKCGNVCTKLKGRSHCEEICADAMRPGALCKVFVGVVMPIVAPSGVSTFDLCQGGKCVKAGEVSAFGSTTNRALKPSKSQIDDKNFILMETDVSPVIKEQGWALGKPLVAKMTKSMVGSLPDPVVILRELGKEGLMDRGKVMLSPKEKRRHYGNLLDDYMIV